MTAIDAITNNFTPEFTEFLLKHMPIKRTGKSKEMAATIAYFASVDSADTAGQIIDVSNGFGMPTPVYSDMIAMKQNVNRF